MARFKLVTIIAIVLFFCGCARAGIITGMIPPVPQPEISDPEIIKSFAAQTIKQRNHTELSLVAAGPEVDRVQNVLDRLLAANRSPHKYFAFVVNNNISNAFTDGRAIYVNRRLLSKLRDDHDLAAIVSHELAHISAGHSMEEATTLEDSDGGTALVSAIIGSPRSDKAIRMYNFNAPVTAKDSGRKVTRISLVVGTASFVSAYALDQEREADEIGMMMSAKAGYNPVNFVDFWAHANNILGPTSSGLLATHPSYEERRQNLAAALPIASAYYSCTIKTKNGLDTDRSCEELLRNSECSAEYCTDYRKN